LLLDPGQWYAQQQLSPNRVFPVEWAAGKRCRFSTPQRHAMQRERLNRQFRSPLAPHIWYSLEKVAPALEIPRCIAVTQLSRAFEVPDFRAC